MSPSTSQSSSTKTTKPPGKDIRTFFGGGGTPSNTGSSKLSKHFSSTPKTVPQSTNKSDVIEIDDEEDELPIKPRNFSSKRKAAFISSDEDEEVTKKSPPKKKQAATPRNSNAMGTKATPKAKTKVVTSDEEDEEKVPPKKQAPVPKATPKASAKAPAKPRPSAAKPRKRKAEDDDYEEELADEDVTEKKRKGKAKESAKPVQQEGAKKFNWAASKAAKLSGPSAPGSKSIPDGAPNCLAGLAFVFTGELSSFSREEAVDLAKRFGGRVVGQPSGVTNFVVLGDNAGPSKLAAIRKHGLKTLDEDAFLNLIATRKSGAVDAKTKAKMAKEEENIRKAAEDMERTELEAEKKRAKAAAKAKAGPSASGSVKSLPDMQSQLWTTRYAPQTLKEICGNKGQVEKLQGWLHDWSASVKSDFRKPGKNGMNIYRAVLITGPPGIGKTTSAHLCAKLEGFTPIELNASDARSKKLVENSTNITNTSLDGWMGGGKSTNAAGIEITDKSCLIMDEVDGMSAGDRGGVGALNALIKKAKIPIICIANDRNAQKLKPLVHTTFNLSFRKPEATSIRSRIMTIAFKEKMKIPANVVDQLVLGAQSDIRQVLNMLSTWKLSSTTMDFDEGKNLAKLNEKYSIMTPFNVINKMLGPYLFSPTARETLGDKMELYFHDHSFIPLFIQENYLKTEPAKTRNASGPEKTLQHLKLMDRAASSISDGDLVDSLIHGSEQHWSLMPLHAVTSTVRPASFLYGNGAGYGGPMAMSFPQWLGQNSKQNKLTRQLGDVQIRMRLKVSGDKPEIRQHYIPSLHPRIVKPLIDVGSSAVEEVIETMDDYYLSKEDWNTIIELGLDQNKDDVVLKKISTATKTHLTRKYNTGEHPVPFHKAQEFGKVPKKLAGGPAPDLEEAFDLDEDVDEEPDPKDEEADEDVSKDSFIKAGGKGKGKSAVKGKGKTKK
ncbi:DNA replication factor C, large subunit [Phellopilus nigrolimitatus]|nr:DNA replication factor C, large subunit [Phellopilus nigrolimitatus]